nr:ABC transporter permease [uncultured Blautia sp.]
MENKQATKKLAYKNILVKYWLAFFMVAIFILFTAIQPSFAGISNIITILNTGCIYGIVSMGLNIVMCTGEIDFAVGAELTLSAVAVAKLCSTFTFGNAYVAAVILSLIVAIVFGVVNVFLNVHVGIPAFIATMGTSLVATGICKYLTNSGSIYSSTWPKEFIWLGQGYLFNTIPISTVCLIIIVIIMWVYTEKTKGGKLLYYVGSNSKACEYIGVNIKKVKYKAFIICALLCGFAGILQASELNSANPYLGDNSMLNGLTAIMVGATFFHIGIYNIPGTVLASILVCMIENGMVMLGAPNFAKYLVKSAILLAAVTIVTVIKKRQMKSIG